MNKTYSQSAKDVSREWYQLDAAGVPLGRLSTQAAQLLIGKSKPKFTPHIDGGDYVVIINASQVVLTGKKDQEFKHRHSGYPGGITSVAKGSLRTQRPDKLITEAIKGMLPKNKLQTGRLLRLKVYAGPEHEHSAQQPKVLEVNHGR